MPDTTDTITKALTSLGATADEIAETLVIGGWRGLRNDAGACPISRYLTSVLPGADDVVTGTAQLTVLSRHAELDVDLPPAVEQFVRAFDDGGFPDLVVTVTDAQGDPIDDLTR
ncbi:hypothetical protein [Mangrovihabitans endophyticus]|uniref:Uncharacterized protein n=1 Tax=Mangrovihabitans endophyticus TaxID=1751298 RepID=A0A8J3C4D9_9ACTN|nr:hypothetical protein [Mangrovihabitans endophyticus]GGL05329.1 hypothetical protein GCM10012284_44760 [Mangrovihabitans endophyticus]